jgi:hypothetical protein
MMKHSLFYRYYCPSTNCKKTLINVTIRQCGDEVFFLINGY